MEYKIYWQVSGEHIHGTTDSEQASTFQIKRISKKKFAIVHETEHNTKRYATSQKSGLSSPLKLVRCANQRDISFDLKNDTRASVHVPRTEAKWQENSPFLIKLPRHDNSFRIAKGSKSKFITLIKHSEQSDTAQAVKADSRLKNTDTEQELQPQYMVASCESLDSGDHDLMLFYFEPAVGGGLPGVTFNPPPPPPSGICRVQSDCGELPCGDINSSSIEEVDGPDDIDHAFINLVGDEYIFPTQV